MTEREFWLTLEFRICHEFAGMADRYLQYLWCDGFIPVQYLLEDDPPQIIGRVWICNDRKQDQWDFTLFLPAQVESRNANEWRALIPARDTTCWIAVDRDRKRLEVEPAAAVPDLA
jgi:hypothetical protein